MEWPARALFGLLLAGCAVAAIFAGGRIFSAVVAVLAFATAREWHRLVVGPRYAYAAFATCVAIGVAIFWLVAAPGSSGPLCVLVLGSAAAAIFAKSAGASPFWSGLGPLYIGLPALCLVALRMRQMQGIETVLVVFLAVWAADTGALAAGRFIGGPKLVPRLSPNKTWAGLIAGTLLSMVAVAGFLGFQGGRIWQAALLASGFALAGAAGDLFESWVKRQMGCKDSGGLIPGHGGVLDRLDSTLFAAPFAAFLVFVVGLDPLCGAHP
jgi:phosphatidate cytidylyltransferase